MAGYNITGVCSNIGTAKKELQFQEAPPIRTKKICEQSAPVSMLCMLSNYCVYALL